MNTKAAIKVSVIIPFFNNKKWLTEALTSVENQTYRNFEVFIIDDGSSEDLSGVKSRFPNYTFMKIDNSGAGVARNIGIKLATGKYAAFLDSDDIWVNNKLQRQVEFMEATDFLWSHTGFLNFDNDSKKIIKVVNSTKFQNDVYLKGFITCPIATPCVMIKVSLLRQNQDFRFNEKMRQGQDTFLWYSLSEKFPLGYIGETLSKIRIRGNNTSFSASSHLRVKSNVWVYFMKNKKNIPVRIKFPYYLSYLSYNSLGAIIEDKVKKSTFEKISKILYVIPYLILKVQKK